MLISLISFVLYPSASNQVLILMIISFNERINAFNPVIKLTFRQGHKAMTNYHVCHIFP